MDTIIHIHVPKTGGMSLVSQQEAIYGKENVIKNYFFNILLEDGKDEFSFTQQYTARQDYKVISGHFPAKRFEDLEGGFRFTFLRHPLDNLLSIYAMLCTLHALPQLSDVIKGVRKKLSFREFILIPRYRWLYTQTFFGDFNMDHLNFIGDMADYNNELLRLGTMLGVSFDLNIKSNVTADNPSCPSQYKNNKEELLQQIHSNDSFKEVLADDISFYETYKGN